MYHAVPAVPTEPLYGMTLSDDETEDEQGGDASRSRTARRTGILEQNENLALSTP